MSHNDSKYFMTISLNVLNHMGLNLYSNVPAVLAEVIANSWDADATEVNIDFDLDQKTITVSDNGCGMDLDDVNSKYLYVGYQKRSDDENREGEILTPVYKRKPMGRKGIGKLSLFSIANKIQVYTRMEKGSTEAFLMDADKIKEVISAEDPSEVRRYEPEPIDIKDIELGSQGTLLKIRDLKKLRLTKMAVEGLRRRIARRFSIIGDAAHFAVKVDGSSITLADRDYFHKARFIYQYGADYAKNCANLEKDESGSIAGSISRNHIIESTTDLAGIETPNIQGWIAIAWRSNDLDGDRQTDNDNLNKITVVVRGKVAQEDILQEFRIGGMITKYMFGEIEADFLDLDDYPDIATSSRQRISEDDERYETLTRFIGKELKAIWAETNKLRERAGVKYALASNPYLKQWYDGLRPPRLKKLANKIFGDIDKAGIDESERQNAYANGVLMFEHLKLNNTIDLLEQIDITKVDEFLNYLRDVDVLEAEHYRRIVEERLVIIRKLRECVDLNAKERVLQEYIFDHLFLLDPGWERATQFEDMEKRMEKALDSKQGRKRVDIKFTKYRRVAAAHVIVELKRSSVTTTKTDLESQVREYIEILKNQLRTSAIQNSVLPIQAVCIVGKLPSGWEQEKTRQTDEESLRLYGIRVLTYDELIENAFQAYGKFIEVYKSQSHLQELMEQIRTFAPPAS